MKAIYPPFFAIDAGCLYWRAISCVTLRDKLNVLLKAMGDFHHHPVDAFKIPSLVTAIAKDIFGLSRNKII